MSGFEFGRNDDDLMGEVTRGAKALVVLPDMRLKGGLDAESRLDEALGLARAIGIEIADAFILPIRAVRPATLFGEGHGDCGGAWVDETAAIGSGRRTARSDADRDWQALDAAGGDTRVRVFRLPGIYGPGRSAFDRLRDGTARRVIAPGQVFSRVHVDDIAGGVIAGMAGPPGVYNLADDEPSDPNTVIEFAARLMGIAPPPLMTIEQATMSPMARAFYAENRRIANGKALRVLGWRPKFADYRAGLRDLNATTSPISARTAPATFSPVQR